MAIIQNGRITFTTRFLGRVDVVDLCDLLVGVLPRTISKVNVDIDATRVVQAFVSLKPLFPTAYCRLRIRQEVLFV